MGPRRNSLAVRVERRTDALARRMLAAFVEQIPLYGQLPGEQLEGEILDVLRHNLAVFFRSLRGGGTVGESDLVPIRASAARRAQERIPLDAVLTAYHLGALLGWEALAEEAGPDEQEELLAAAGHMLAYTQTVTAVVADAYVEERQAIYGEERDARRALAEALLTGAPAKALAARLGYEVAPGYVVVALSVGTSPDEKDTGVGGAVAARRKLRRLEDELVAAAGEDVLAMLNPAGGSVLLPADAEACDAVVASVDGLVDRLAAAAGADVVAGLAWAESARVGPAAEVAREIVRLACADDRGPGAYTLDDVLLEYLLSRPSDAADRLAAVLDPLESGPELVATLEGWFAADFDRRRAAADLHIHPNTLDYRLRRVAELTGLSPATARGVQVLGAGLIVHRLRAERG